MAPTTPSRCPRCQGRLLEHADQYGRYKSCLTCGFGDECWHGPTLTLVDSQSGRERRREPTHGRQRL